MWKGWDLLMRLMQGEPLSWCSTNERTQYFKEHPVNYGLAKIYVTTNGQPNRLLSLPLNTTILSPWHTALTNGTIAYVVTPTKLQRWPLFFCHRTFSRHLSCCAFCHFLLLHSGWKHQQHWNPALTFFIRAKQPSLFSVIHIADRMVLLGGKLSQVHRWLKLFDNSEWAGGKLQLITSLWEFSIVCVSFVISFLNP